ncbi:MAG: beta-lactamase family protein [Flavobacteriales bacterium]|nr:MAG: beta-lactamase family protein [Flavobacteriales bacterium]
MHTVRGLLYCALLIGLKPVTRAQGPTVTAVPGAIQLVEDQRAENAFEGVAVGFSVVDDTTWDYGAGWADRSSRIAFAPDTRTRIASITKPMTAIAIMQLAEQGRLHLDSAVRVYVPEFPEKPEGRLTVRQLLQHSAGLDDYASNKERENRNHFTSLTEAMGIFMDRELISAPGAAFHYTTYGYVLLGVVVERVSGMSYEAYMQRHIWSPASMLDTGVEGRDTSGTKHAELYHTNGKGRVLSADHTDLSDRIPGGGVYSTAADMLRFGDALLRGTLLEPKTLAAMWIDPALKKDGNGYGMGWYLYGQNPKYGPVYGHNGAQTGASTFLMLLPEQKTSIIVLSNTSGAMQAVSAIAVGLFDHAAAAAAFH